MSGLAVDTVEIGRFVDALFRYAGDGSYVALRAFEHGTNKPVQAARASVKINGMGLDTLVAVAATKATATAMHSASAVFCPPVCTFTNAERARERDLANGLTISVELDERPADGLARLAAVLDEPTLVVESGGEWIDPATGEIEPKLHVHYRLTEPTREAEDHAKLKKARGLAAALTGGDTTNNPAVHPIRWAGSVHNKNPECPRLARIVGGDAAREVELREALEQLEAAAAAAGAGGSGDAGRTGEQAEAPGADADERATREALDLFAKIIPNEDAAWDDWSKMAMRFHAASGGSDIGLEAFLVWSRKCAKHDEANAHTKWEHVGLYPPDRTGFDKLAALAREELNRVNGGWWSTDAGKTGGKRRAAEDGEWQQPESLADPADEPAPFPLDQLPAIVGDAVREYATYGQQPVPLIVGSTLGTMSLATQGIANVRRDAALVGPLSLNVVVVAASGERKTASDLTMRRGADAWQIAERRRLAPQIAERQAEAKAHEAQFAGLLSKLRNKQQEKPSSSRQADIEALKVELKALARERPIPPPIPTPFIEDTTPEGVSRDLRSTWPSSSLWSNEGGIVVGGHAFSDDRAMMTLALLNKLWDGQPLDRSRSTEERSLVWGRRLTANILLQPTAFSRLLDAQEGLARGLGTLARFLLAWPPSTMGSRAYRQPVDADFARAFPAVATFAARVEELLRLPLPMAYDMETGDVMETDDEFGRPTDALELHLPDLPLSRAARDVWIEYQNEVERELKSEGEYSTVRDVAAKSAENACRLAAIFHVFADDAQGEVGASDMERGARIAGWYLYEARRMLSGTAAGDGDDDLSDSRLLANWLLARRAPPSLKELAQEAPYRLRLTNRRKIALAFLMSKHWIRIQKLQAGGASIIVLNPAIREGARP